MKIEKMKVKNLIPYINNPKQHPEHQINLIASSIKEFGFINPIILDKDNEIIAGHGRLLAAKKLGLKEVPVLRVSNLTPAQVKAYRIADNRLTEIGNWDIDMLKVEVEQIKELEEEFDLDLLGFDGLNEMVEEAEKSFEYTPPTINETVQAPMIEEEYTPEYTPKYERKEVEEEDIHKVDLQVESKEQKSTKKEITCPNCLNTFYIEE